MRFLLNVLWFVFGGFVMGLSWWLSGLLMVVTIVGIPWARSCFVIGTLAFWPFGREVIARDELTGRDDLGTGAFGFVGNVLWFLVFGVWLCLGHLSVALASALTIIGIPFAIQHVKLAIAALAPVGRTVVTVEEADAARRRRGA